MCFESSPKAFASFYPTHTKAYVELRVGVKSGHTYIEYIVRSKDWTLGEIQPYSLIKTLFVDGNEGGKEQKKSWYSFFQGVLSLLLAIFFLESMAIYFSPIFCTLCCESLSFLFFLSFFFHRG